MPAKQRDPEYNPQYHTHIKGTQIRMEEIRLSLLAEDMIICVENSRL
jgi:hypothetical protein